VKWGRDHGSGSRFRRRSNLPPAPGRRRPLLSISARLGFEKLPGIAPGTSPANSEILTVIVIGDCRQARNPLSTTRVPHDETKAILLSLCWAVSAGAFLTVIARKFGLPAIVLLFAAGVVMGPEILGLVDTHALEPLLPAIVSLSIGLILFEGGLTLDLRGYEGSSKVIPRLLTIGVLVTWLGTSAAVWAIFDFPISFSLLAGSLVIVTGPTVIIPLLKRVRLAPTVHHILHWEGVLIDAIGVFVAVACYEWVVQGHRGETFSNLAVRLLAGVLIGIAGGWLIAAAYRLRLVPSHVLNVFALGGALLIFGITEAIISEAGLLAVTIAGLVVGWRKPFEVRALRAFKAELVDILIGMLFVLLAARLKLGEFIDFGWKGVLLLVVVLIAVRPLAVFFSSLGTGLGWREKVFLGWVAPRGIVAASMASLFAISLAEQETDFDPAFLQTFVFAVIAATVVIQGASAGTVARLLGLRRPKPNGWLIVGCNLFSRRVARLMKREANIEVTIIDTNARRIAEARSDGLKALIEDGMNVAPLMDRIELQSVGKLLALTDNADLNELLCRAWGERLGRENVIGYSPRAADPEAEAAHARDTLSSQLPKPSVVSKQLEEGEAQLHVVEGKAIASSASSEIPLFILRNKEVYAVEGNGSQRQYREGDKVIVLRTGEKYLLRALQNGQLFRMKPESFPALYHDVVERLTTDHPEVSKEESLNELLSPTKIVPAFLGRGVAVPHLYLTGLAQRVCYLVRLDPPLPYDEAGTEEPIRLVFFLASPIGDPEGHLATLAEIARLCSAPDRREKLSTIPEKNDLLKWVEHETED